MINTMDLVKIKWLDAMSDDNTWQDISDLRQQQLRPVETVGWILTEFGGKMVTVSSYDDETKTGGGGVVIPTNCITEVQYLEGGRCEQYENGKRITVDTI
jgi:hypothetical protein|tara:strand:- start:1681 stop:1980 length:300 start_codon:yes stop_codon:yes gene_type:complete